LKGPCGEKIIKLSEVEAEAVEEEKATGTFIKWFFKPEETPLYAMRVFEVKPGGHIKAHSHPWEHEIYVLKGKGRIRVGESFYDVEEDTAIYIPPNVIHEYWNTGESVLRFICTIPNKPTAKEEQVKC